MQLGLFTAHIIVDGKALVEFDVVRESPTNVTCWIASEEGKSFGVEWKCHEEKSISASQGLVFVDGIGCGKKAILPGRSNTNTFTHFIKGTIRRELIFARVELSDDDSLLNKEIPRNLGEICLKIQRGRQVRKNRRASKNALPLLGDNKFHERSKKATAHCVGFGPEIARNRPLYSWRLIPDNDPTLNFVFRYQSLGVLQANGIAPRTTPNDANVGRGIGSSELDVETAPSADIKPGRLDDRIRNLENELRRLQNLRSRNSEDRKPKQIKREESGK